MTRIGEDHMHLRSWSHSSWLSVSLLIYSYITSSHMSYSYSYAIIVLTLYVLLQWF